MCLLMVGLLSAEYMQRYGEVLYSMLHAHHLSKIIHLFANAFMIFILTLGSI